MSDLVERLKAAHPKSSQYAAGSNILLEAANRIQRLEKLMAKVQVLAFDNVGADHSNADLALVQINAIAQQSAS